MAVIEHCPPTLRCVGEWVFRGAATWPASLQVEDRPLQSVKGSGQHLAAPHREEDAPLLREDSRAQSPRWLP